MEHLHADTVAFVLPLNHEIAAYLDRYSPLRSEVTTNVWK